MTIERERQYIKLDNKFKNIILYILLSRKWKLCCNRTTKKKNLYSKLKIQL